MSHNIVVIVVAVAAATNYLLPAPIVVASLTWPWPTSGQQETALQLVTTLPPDLIAQQWQVVRERKVTIAGHSESCGRAGESEIMQRVAVARELKWPTGGGDDSRISNLLKVFVLLSFIAINSLVYSS